MFLWHVSCCHIPRYLRLANFDPANVKEDHPPSLGNLVWKRWLDCARFGVFHGVQWLVWISQSFGGPKMLDSGFFPS